MSLKRDSVTAWTRANGEAIANHRSQPLPKTAGGIFGGSVFGLASRTLGITAPSLLGRLSPTDLFDSDALIGAGKDYLLSKVGSAINGALAGNSRQWLESQNHHNLYGSTTGYRFNHKIEDRGYLTFGFPKEAIEGVIAPEETLTIGGTEFPVFHLPFFENPKISESRSAEYASHKIVNRNEPYRLWTGAKPTKVSLSFNITLPHLMTFANIHMSDVTGKVLQSNDFKNFILRKLRELSNSEGTVVDDNIAMFFPGMIPSPAQLQSFTQLPESKDFYELTNKILTDIGHPKGLAQNSTSDKSDRARLIVYTTYLLNLIRSSVIGSSNSEAASSESTPGKGDAVQAHVRRYLPAPVIFLTYGSMYNNSPFIATNYSITFDGKSGYEELSLLPRVIQIKLTLESFNQFENSDKIFGIPKIFGDKDE